MTGFLLAALLVAAPLPAEQEAAIDALFAEYRKPGVPGCAVGVVKDGELVFARGYGLANLDWGLPIGPRTVFALGSASKEFTSMVVHLLDREGRLSLDDDVRRWIPELPDLGPKVTLRHLLLHTSGIRSGVGRLAFQNFGDMTTEQWLWYYARQRGYEFEPGTAWSYSSLGYPLLALVVQRATGSTLRKVAAERFFEPLGMTQTLVLDDAGEVVPQRATGHVPAGDERLRTWLPTGTGGHSVWSTVEDLARWQRHLEEPRAGVPALAPAMLEPSPPSRWETPEVTMEVGAGMCLIRIGDLRSIGHPGLEPGFAVHLLWYPDHRLHTILLCNRGDAPYEMKGLALAGILLGRTLQVWSDAPPHPAVASLAGLYRHVELGTQLRLGHADGKLYLGDARTGQPLRHVGGGRYVGGGGMLTGDGKRIQIVGTLDRDAVLERIVPHRPTAAGLRRAVGRYYAEELDVLWEISLVEDRLTLRIQGGEPRRLSPGLPGEWVSGDIALRLEPGRGPARGFRAYSGTVLGMPFRRVRIDAGPGATPAPTR